MSDVNIEKLRIVVKALRDYAAEHPNREKQPFDMRGFVYPTCGTPSCALGHYAASPLQSDFIIHTNYDGLHDIRWSNSAAPHLAGRPQIDDDVAAMFGLAWPDEYYELFGIDGCGNAQTEEEAAAYIEAFISEKEAAQ